MPGFRIVCCIACSSSVASKKERKALKSTIYTRKHAPTANYLLTYYCTVNKKSSFTNFLIVQAVNTQCCCAIIRCYYTMHEHKDRGPHPSRREEEARTKRQKDSSNNRNRTTSFSSFTFDNTGRTKVPGITDTCTYIFYKYHRYRIIRVILLVYYLQDNTPNPPSGE